MRILLAAAALAALTPAQGAGYTVTIANLSPRAQALWVDVAVPQVPGLTAAATFGEQRWPAFRARDVGSHSTVYSIRAELPGNGRVTGRLEPEPDAPLPPFAPSPAIAAAGRSLFPELRVRHRDEHHRAAPALVELVETGPARQVWHARTAPWHGFVAECWLYLWAGQDAARLHANAGWSDRDDPRWQTHVQGLHLTTAHELACDFAVAENTPVARWERPEVWATTLLWDRPAGDGEQVRVRGTLLVGAAAAADSPARGGPMRAVCHDWDGRWLCFGATPRRPSQENEEQRFAKFRGRLRQRGDPWDKRLWCGAKGSAQTGAQWGFGATRGGQAVTAFDPRFLWELEYSDDQPMHAYHHRERDGSRVTFAAHPGWHTWSMRTDPRNASDLLGKDGAASHDGVSGYYGDDDQHYNFANSDVLYALTGDYMVLESYRDATESDLAQARPYRIGAPRAVGRLLKHWANRYLLTDGEDRAKVRRNMERRIDNCARQWVGRRVAPGRVRVVQTMNDPRLYPGRQAWMAWQESIAAMGLYAAWRTIGDERARDIALALGETVTRYAWWQDPQGRWRCCTTLVYRDGGEPWPAERYHADSDVVSTNDSFGDWIVPGVLVFLELAPADHPARPRAEAIARARCGAPPRRWEHASWWAVSGRGQPR